VEGFGDGASWHADVDGVTARLKSELHGAANVLVKGSRFMRMERVVQALREPQAESEET
jgi:UDP-N-acetylmuramoyl-tripeptide--D-alanyl-D-alanine ligase